MGREEIKSIKKNIQKEDTLDEKDMSDVNLEIEPVIGIIKDSIKEPIYTITIYTTNTCNKCRMLINFLSENNISYIEKDAIENYKDIKNSMYASAPLIKVESVDSSAIYDMDGFMTWIRDAGIL